MSCEWFTQGHALASGLGMDRSAARSDYRRARVRAAPRVTHARARERSRTGAQVTDRCGAARGADRTRSSRAANVTTPASSGRNPARAAVFARARYRSPSPFVDALDGLSDGLCRSPDGRRPRCHQRARLVGTLSGDAVAHTLRTRAPARRARSGLDAEFAAAFARPTDLPHSVSGRPACRRAPCRGCSRPACRASGSARARTTGGV